MKDYLNFSGKHVIITGGRRGLGRAMSIAFAERGAKVAVVAANPDGSEIMADLEKAGTPGLYYCCDLSKPEERAGLIDRIAADMDGKVDVLINNAGMQFNESIESCTLENWKTSESILLYKFFSELILCFHNFFVDSSDIFQNTKWHIFIYRGLVLD